MDTWSNPLNIDPEIEKKFVDQAEKAYNDWQNAKTGKQNTIDAALNSIKPKELFQSDAIPEYPDFKAAEKSLDKALQ